MSGVHLELTLEIAGFCFGIGQMSTVASNEEYRPFHYLPNLRGENLWGSTKVGSLVSERIGDLVRRFTMEI
jgi:hypothetical protein